MRKFAFVLFSFLLITLLAALPRLQSKEYTSAVSNLYTEVDSFWIEDSFRRIKYYIHKDNDKLIRNREQYPLVFCQESCFGCITKQERKSSKAGNTEEVMLTEDRYAFTYAWWKNGVVSINNQVELSEKGYLFLKRTESDSLGNLIKENRFVYVRDTLLPDFPVRLSAWFVLE